MNGNIIGLDEAGTELDFQNGNIPVLGRKYSRPWMEFIPALDGNIIGLDGNSSGLGRKYFRPGTQMLSAWTDLFPVFDGNKMVCHVIHSRKQGGVRMQSGTWNQFRPEGLVSSSGSQVPGGPKCEFPVNFFLVVRSPNWAPRS